MSDIQFLRESIIAEYTAILQYTRQMNETESPELKALYASIIQEEKVHVGEFQVALLKLDGEQETALEDGAKEAQPIIKNLTR